MALLNENEVQLRISTTAEGGQELDRLAAKMDGLEKELADVAKASKAANSAQLESANQLNAARVKQDEIKRTLNETNAAYKALIDQVRKGGEGQQKYAAEAAATRQRMEQLRGALNAAGKDVFRLNDEYKRAAAQSRFLAAEQRRVSNQLKDTAGAADRVRARLRELRESAKESAGAFDGLRGKIAAAVAAIGGFIGIKRGFQAITQSAESLDVGMRKIEAAIQATGGAAGLSAVEIGDMAKRLDEATLGSAEGFRDAAAKLLTFKSVGKDAFETTLKLAQDLAATGFGTLESNIVQLGKALENPKQGISALAEAGVTFTDQQKTLITYLVETGKQAQAQGVILDAVAGQVAGVASAVGQGLSGAADLAGKRFTDFKELLGKGLLPVLTGLYNQVADLFKKMNESGAVQRLGDVLATVFKGAAESALRFIAQVDIDALSARMATWADKSGEAVSRWISYVEEAGGVVKLVFSAIYTGANTVMAAIFKIAEAMAWLHGKTAEAFSGIFSILSNLSFGGISEKFASLSNDISVHAGAMGAVTDAFGESASKAFDRAVSGAYGFQSAWAGLTETVPQAGAAIAQVGQQATLSADQVAALGDSTEFVNGVLRETPSVANKAAASVSGLAEKTRKAADEQRALIEKTLAVEQAFAKLGITSSAALKKQADDARAAYDIIKTSGMATAADLKAAFEAYAERAIAANNGIANDALRVEAAMAGVKLKTDKVAESAESAAAAYKKIAKGADEAKTAVEDLGKAQAEASEVRVGGSVTVPKEWVDANGGQVPFTQAQMDRARALAEQNAQLQQAAAAGESSSGPTLSRGTYRIEIQLPGRKSSAVNVASRSDADQLIDIFKLLETDMARAN